MQNRPDNRIYAGFFVRLAAYIVDVLIVWTAMLIVRIPVWITTLASPDNFLVRDFIFQYSIKDILFYIMQAAYFILLTYFTGSTLGKKLFQIRVVSAEERKMTFFEVAFRETVGRFLSALILSIGYIMIAIDKKKRGLHDILSDTNVVYYHEKKVYTHADIHYRNMVDEVQPAPQKQNPYADGEVQSAPQKQNPYADSEVQPASQKQNPYADSEVQPSSQKQNPYADSEVQSASQKQKTYETTGAQHTSSDDETKKKLENNGFQSMPSGYFGNSENSDEEEKWQKGNSRPD